MKNVLKYLFFSFVLLFILDRSLGYLLDLRAARHYSSEGNGRLNHFLNCEQIPDTIFMGSSRVLHNIDPLVFGERAVNLSRNSTHIGYHAAVLDILEKEHKLPGRAIVLNVEPEDLTFQQNKLRGGITALHFFYNTNEFVRDEINSISIDERLKHLSSLYRHNSSVIALLRNGKADTSWKNHNGYYPLYPTAADSIRLVEIMDQNVSFGEMTRENEALRYLDHIRAIAKRNKLDIIVITAPYYRCSSEIARLSQCLEKACKWRGIIYLNFALIPETKFSDRSLWHDNNHFNSKGAEAYSKELKYRIHKH